MQLLQKYIAYARQFCHPVLSDDAKQILKEHYCQLRQDSRANDGTPVTVSSAHVPLVRPNLCPPSSNAFPRSMFSSGPCALIGSYMCGPSRICLLDTRDILYL